MSYFILNPRNKKWEKVGEKFKSLWDLVETSKADGYIMKYQDESFFEEFNKKDTFITCNPIVYKFRKAWLINSFSHDKEYQERTFRFSEVPVDEPEWLTEFYSDFSIGGESGHSMPVTQETVDEEEPDDNAEDGKLF